MKIVWIVSGVVAVIYLLVLLVKCYQTGHFVKAVVLSALSGLVPLFLLSFTSTLTGLSVMLNGWTVSIAAAGGVPGVASMLVLNILL